MKFIKFFLGILALCTYAGCSLNNPSKGTLSYISTSQQFGAGPVTGEPPIGQGSSGLAVKNLSVATPDGTVAFQAEVADTEDTRRTGLMFRKELPKNRGMVFLFDVEGPLTFWMKNTLVPLDIIFMDRDWRVVSIQKEAQPCQAEPCVLYPSAGPAKYVLEINGGLSDKLGIQKGAEVQLQ